MLSSSGLRARHGGAIVSSAAAGKNIKVTGMDHKTHTRTHLHTPTHTWRGKYSHTVSLSDQINCERTWRFTEETSFFFFGTFFFFYAKKCRFIFTLLAETNTPVSGTDDLTLLEVWSVCYWARVYSAQRPIGSCDDRLGGTVAGDGTTTMGGATVSCRRDGIYIAI